MMGVGDVWPGIWHTHDQHNFIKGKSNSEEDDPSSAGPVVSPQASECSIVNLIPQYAASISQAVSMLQEAVARIDDVAQQLRIFETHLTEASRRRLTSDTILVLEGEAAGIIRAIEEMECRFYRCRSVVRPEFSITFDSQPVPVEALAALNCALEQSNHNNMEGIMALEQGVQKTQQALQNYRERAESWLQRLIQVGQANMGLEEQAFGVKGVSCDYRQACLWITELTNAVIETPTALDDIHGSIVSQRVASLLSGSAES